MSRPQIRLRPAATGRGDRTNNTSGSDHITSTEAQRNRLLAYLKHDSITTIEARRDLNLFQPAARCFELRKLGHNIVTRLIDIRDDQGRPHSRVALYSLISGGAK